MDFSTVGENRRGILGDGLSLGMGLDCVGNCVRLWDRPSFSFFFLVHRLVYSSSYPLFFFIHLADILPRSQNHPFAPRG